MDDDRERTEVQVYAWARHQVHERLAFASAAIWACGTFLLFVNLVPPTITKPVPEIVISMMIPILPATIPWLFFPMITRSVARRELRRRFSAG
jgi:hypothetical protein